MGFCVYRRSYLIGSPAIIQTAIPTEKETVTQICRPRDKQPAVPPTGIVSTIGAVGISRTTAALTWQSARSLLCAASPTPPPKTTTITHTENGGAVAPARRRTDALSENAPLCHTTCRTALDFAGADRRCWPVGKALSVAAGLFRAGLFCSVFLGHCFNSLWRPKKNKKNKQKTSLFNSLLGLSLLLARGFMLPCSSSKAGQRTRLSLAFPRCGRPCVVTYLGTHHRPRAQTPSRTAPVLIATRSRYERTGGSAMFPSRYRRQP